MLLYMLKMMEILLTESKTSLSIMCVSVCRTVYQAYSS